MFDCLAVKKIVCVERGFVKELFFFFPLWYNQPIKSMTADMMGIISTVEMGISAPAMSVRTPSRLV